MNLEKITRKINSQTSNESLKLFTIQGKKAKLTVSHIFINISTNVFSRELYDISQLKEKKISF